MQLFLIRHTKPAVDKGVCYGQTDLDVVTSFEEEANAIQSYLPNDIKTVFSSPLQRCSKLAKYLFNENIEYHHDLMELNCGHWEMQHWDEIPPEVLQPWMDDFVQVRIPGGESYIDLYERVIRKYDQILQQPLPAAIVAHGGVIRSILAHITQTPLTASFQRFPLHYGCIAQIDTVSGKYEMIYNRETAKEQHKPSSFYK